MFTLPNIITLMNLACGCGAVVMSLVYGDLVVAFGLVCVAAVCDFADGAAARLLKKFSRIGVELDSLADVVSFGVAPSAILWVMFGRAECVFNLPDWAGWGVFVVALCGALRLARFGANAVAGDNCASVIEDSGVSGGRKSVSASDLPAKDTDFRGLPIPAAALAIASLGVVGGGIPKFGVLLVAVLLGVLMISNLRMPSLKFEGLGWRANRTRYILVLAAIFAIALFGVAGVAVAVGFYIVVSLVLGVRSPKSAAVVIAVLCCSMSVSAQNVTPWQDGRSVSRPINGQATTAAGHDGHDHEHDEAATAERPATPFFGEGTEAPEEDTVKKKRPKKPLESYHFDYEQRAQLTTVWNVDEFANHLYIREIDTLQADFQTRYPFMRQGVGSAYLGNLGAPSIPLSFFDRVHSHHPSFVNAWSAYLRKPEDVPFYNVKKPFTQLGYVWAGQRQQQEEDLTVIHAQNINPSTGFNLDYRSLGTRGIYDWQATRDKTLSLAFNHTGKRYTVHAGYIHNQVYNRENGGISDDDEILVNINEHEMTQNIPMRMSDPRNRVRSNTYFLVQSYGVPLRRVREEDFTIADRPAFYLGHSIEYSRWSRRYEDTYDGTVFRPIEGGEAPRPYYDHWHYNPTASRDSLFEGRLANRVFVQLQPWDRGGVIGTIDAGIGVDVRNYYQFTPDQYLTGVEGREVRETEYYAYAGAQGNFSRYFSWGADAMFHPFGDAKGDMEIGAEVSARLFVKGRPMTVSGRVRHSSLTPSFWESTFSTNHFIWNLDLERENETRFDVGLEIPHIGLEARLSQSVLGNAFYYGADARPAQNDETVSVTGFYVREDVRIPVRSSSINLNHRVMLQHSSNQSVVPVPSLAAYVSYFFEFNVVRDVMRMQIGVDGRYNTMYYAPGYNPGTGQFYNQREKQLGDYIWLDAFVSAKWKRMRIALKMDHLSDDMLGSRNYFSVLHYPMNRRVLKLGVSWNFYD